MVRWSLRVHLDPLGLRDCWGRSVQRVLKEHSDRMDHWGPTVHLDQKDLLVPKDRLGQKGHLGWMGPTANQGSSETNRNYPAHRRQAATAQ
jgi:hypothetical protein